MVPLYHGLLSVPHADKRKLEEALVGSGEEFTIVRPSLLVDVSRLDAMRSIDDKGAFWRIGGAVTHSAIEDAKLTGCTVHYVTAEVDGGPIIDQAAVRIELGDTLDLLTAKIHAAEHALLPSVIALLAG